MKKFWVILLAVFLFAVFIFFVFKLPQEETETIGSADSSRGSVQEETGGLVSEYFEKEFESEETDTKLSVTPGFETCELFGNEVKEGTVIFDSTCTPD